MSDNLSLAYVGVSQVAVTRQNNTGIFWFKHYGFPALLLLSSTAALFVLAVLLRQRRRTNIAISVLLIADVLVLCSEALSKLLAAGLVRHKDFLHTFILQTVRILPGYIQCVITAERLVAVAWPLRVKRLVTKTRLLMLLTAVIVAALGVEVAYKVWMMSHPIPGKVYAIHLTVFYCALPTLFLSVCSTSIVVILSRQRARTADAHSIRLALIFVVINVIYILTSLPYAVQWFFTPWLHQEDDVVETVTGTFMQFGPMTDWALLLGLSRQIKRDAAKLCHCRTEEVRRTVRVCQFSNTEDVREVT